MHVAGTYVGFAVAAEVFLSVYTQGPCVLHSEEPNKEPRPPLATKVGLAFKLRVCAVGYLQEGNRGGHSPTDNRRLQRNHTSHAAGHAGHILRELIHSRRHW